MRTKTIAEVFVREIVCRYGDPLEVHTDQGRNFDCKLIKKLSQLLGIRKTRATPLHPQSNGQVERQYRTILEYLSKYITDNQKDWDRWVSLYLLAYRSSAHATTGVTPAEMYTGTDLRLPLDLIRGCPPEEEIVLTMATTSRNSKPTTMIFTNQLERTFSSLPNMRKQPITEHPDMPTFRKFGCIIVAE